MTWHRNLLRNSSAICSIGLLVLGASVLTRPVCAQTVVEEAKVAAEINRVASNLPDESRQVITRLTLMRELPDGAWKMHSGDLAHGEAENLDDSGWQSFAVPGRAPNNAVWFRQTYTVPETLAGYDLTG